MNALSILVADDEEEIRQLLETWLKPLGHAVLTARNGTEGLKLLRTHRVDLAVTDVLMPDGDGPTLIAGLKQLQPAARVLAISGGGRYMTSEEYLKIASGFGADGAIMKPFNRGQFLEAIDRAMARPTVPPQ